MKKSIELFFALGLIITLTSCDNETIRAEGEVTSREYSFIGYSNLEISDAFEVFVRFSDTEESITILANDNLHEEIRVRQSGNSLQIGLQPNTSVKGQATMEAYIVTNDLAGFEVSGASSILLEDEWVTTNGDISLSGASDFTGPVDINNLDIDMSGASETDIFGQVIELDADLSGSSELRDYDLDVDELVIRLSGSSDAFLSALGTIDVRASGASDLNYQGNAEIIRQELSGSSSVKKRD